MIKILATYLLLTSPLLFAKVQTEYYWSSSINKKGKCYEVDSKTKGSLYSNKVANELCRPQKTATIFNYKKGSCFEVDADTWGRKYFNKVKNQECKTSKTKIYYGKIHKKTGCFEIDSPSLGKKYYRKVKEDLCKKKEKDFFWKPQGRYKGQCFVQNKSGEYFKVRPKNCRPQKVIYSFKREGALKGSCFEQHSKDSLRYSQKTALKKCKPQSTHYSFSKRSNTLQGDCFEIDSQTNGNLYIKKVATKLCKQ